MAKGESSDLFMKLVQSGSPTGTTAIKAEATTSPVAAGQKPNKLLNGFVQGQLFEIESFTFRAGVAIPSKVAPGREGQGVAAGSSGAPDANAARLRELTERMNEMMKRANKAAEEDKDGKHVDVQPITFKRNIDTASKTMIKFCIDCTPIDSITLIKRKAAGGKASGETYLRMDFQGCLITKVDWSNDAQVAETVEFIYRSVTVHYKPQLPDGSLGAVKSAFWKTLSSELKEVDLR